VLPPAHLLEVLAMPAPRWLARVNRKVTNHITGPLASRLPGLGVVVHTGRKSHRPYRTPVSVFPRGDRYTIALTYGADSQWVKNVLASGGCTLETRGRALRLARPRLFHDERRQAMPAPVRVILSLLDVTDFLELTVEHGAAEQPRREPG
jgi:deazaflavin-dependent oxidoreductase (nitroreductase family)